MQQLIRFFWLHLVDLVLLAALVVGLDNFVHQQLLVVSPVEYLDYQAENKFFFIFLIILKIEINLHSCSQANIVQCGSGNCHI